MRLRVAQSPTDTDAQLSFAGASWVESPNGLERSFNVGQMLAGNETPTERVEGSVSEEVAGDLRLGAVL